jgi:hypothetical protein
LRAYFYLNDGNITIQKWTKLEFQFGPISSNLFPFYLNANCGIMRKLHIFLGNEGREFYSLRNSMEWDRS